MKIRKNQNILISFLILVALYGVVIYFATKKTTTPKPTPIPTSTEVISSAEKQRVDEWIKENNLNQYGGPLDTVYTGGTPLFNEATGETIDRYKYILKKYPHSPWNK